MSLKYLFSNASTLNVFTIGWLTIVFNVMCLLYGVVNFYAADFHFYQRVHDGWLFVLIELRQLLGWDHLNGHNIQSVKCLGLSTWVMGYYQSHIIQVTADYTVFFGDIMFMLTWWLTPENHSNNMVGLTMICRFFFCSQGPTVRLAGLNCDAGFLRNSGFSL